MAALEVISGHILNLATLTNLTMNQGDSLTVRNFDDRTKRAWLLNMWALVTAAGVTEVHSPRMHDNNHAIRERIAANQPQPLMPLQFPQRVYAVDQLIVQLAGDATAARIQPMSMMMYYEDVQGLAARLAKPADVFGRMVNMFTLETTLTGAVTGDYSASAAINANFDGMIADTDYAILGYVVDVQCASVHWRGVDVGNVRVGGPGLANLVHLTSEWFVRISDETGLPLVPIFNSQNKTSMLLDCLMSQAGGTFNVNTIMAQLKPAA